MPEDTPEVKRSRTGAPKVGRPSNVELARRLNQARVQLCRERKKNAKEDADEAALLAQVSDPSETQTFEAWAKLSPELFQLQLDYLDCRDLGLPLFVAGESPEERTARVYEAILAHDGIDHEQALERVQKWKREREEKARPIPPQRDMPLVSDDLPAPVTNPAPVDSNPSHVPTLAQTFQTASEKEIEFERRRLQEHNLLNGVNL